MYDRIRNEIAHDTGDKILTFVHLGQNKLRISNQTSQNIHAVDYSLYGRSDCVDNVSSKIKINKFK